VLIVETDYQGVITNANDAYCQSLGFTKSQLIDKKHKLILPNDINKAFFQEIWNTINSNKRWSGEIFNYTSNNETKYFNTYIEPLFHNKVKVGYRAICEDISDKKIIEKISITDKLTGIFNRLRLDELIVEQLHTYERYKIDFSIIIIDIDNFKLINDTYGHDVGDKVIQQLATCLQSKIRATDYVGRWGGEEFLVFCPNTPAKNALIPAEYIRKSVEQDHYDEVDKITISLGVTGVIEGDTVNSIFKRADQALYKAKRLGKNNSVIM
jgi:diguanylate cyclase (GGDEF)-like protein/PAS domain S-box-containing protein